MFERRNLAASDPQPFTTGRAQWSDWTIQTAVTEGMRASGWVYKCVNIIAENAASVPFVVVNADGEALPDHPLSKKLANPNPSISRSRVYHLLVAWLQLAGNAYLHDVSEQLWPISPDRLAPIPSKDPDKLKDGYEVEKGQGNRVKSPDHTTENVLHFQIPNPANPLQGLGPLQAAAKAVDLDSEQMDWNVAAMQNRGVVDGLFSFKKEMQPNQFQTALQKIKEKWGGKARAREPLVIGHDADYKRMALTPAEMDWLQSRRFNREEIASIFGVPLQLIGSQEASTYNNYSQAVRVFWETTVTSVLDQLKDGFNFHYWDQLGEGEEIVYDLSNVSAMRESEDEKAATAKRYFEMGIPIQQINQKLELGIEEFDGWDQPWTGRHPLFSEGGQVTGPQGNEGGDRAEDPRWELRDRRQQDLEAEAERKEELATGEVGQAFHDLLGQQEERVFQALDDNADIEAAVREDHDAWAARMTEVFDNVAHEFVGTVVVQRDGRPYYEVRQTEEDSIDELIRQILEDENVVLRDLAMIEETTAALVMEQVTQGLANEDTVQEIKEAILDVGAFSEARALRIARTEVGTAASIGQLAAGKASGARTKTWQTSLFEVRGIHQNREGETVGIDETFSVQAGTVAPRFPGDPRIAARDRINCRCSLTFSM
jgi:HK97 family phage portal protein